MLVLLCLFYSVNPSYIYPYFIPFIDSLYTPIYSLYIIPLFHSCFISLFHHYFTLYPLLYFLLSIHFFTCIFSNFAVHLAILPLKYNLKNIYPYLIAVYTRSHNFVFIFINRQKNYGTNFMFYDKSKFHFRRCFFR
jgi:hypothetical protein